MTNLLKIFITNILLKALDLLTTAYAIENAGISVEVNPLMRFLIENLGGFSYLINMFVFLIANLMLYKKKSTKVLVFVAVLMFLVCINNIYHVLKII